MIFVVAGIIEKLEQFYMSSPGGNTASLCSLAHHFAVSHGDKGWGCGYRNLQMILSCLATSATYRQDLFGGALSYVILFDFLFINFSLISSLYYLFMLFVNNYKLFGFNFLASFSSLSNFQCIKVSTDDWIVNF